MSQQGKQSGKFRRGNTWKREETLALLEIWGEAKVQQELRFSHRNLDIFEKISQDLRAKGYHRSAFECRTKTKTLRLEYKRVVVHNSRSGNTPAMCPFFPQLHRILRGDASVAPKRVARSFTLRWPVPNQVAHQDPGDVAAPFAQPLLEKDVEVQDIHMGDGAENLAHPESAPEHIPHPEGHVILSPEKEEEEEEEEEEEQKVEGQHSLDARLPEQEFKVEGQPCAPGPSASEDQGQTNPGILNMDVTEEGSEMEYQFDEERQNLQASPTNGHAVGSSGHAFGQEQEKAHDGTLRQRLVSIYHQDKKIVIGLGIFILILILILIILILSNSPSFYLGKLSNCQEDVIKCPSDWFGHQGECYKVSKEEKNRKESQDSCISDNASLAKITDDTTEFLKLISHNRIPWIGLKRESNQPWKWPDGENSTLKVLGDGGDCAYLDDSGTASSGRCSTEHHYICQKNNPKRS